jgi:hypothetical protein
MYSGVDYHIWNLWAGCDAVHIEKRGVFMGRRGVKKVTEKEEVRMVGVGLRLDRSSVETRSI